MVSQGSFTQHEQPPPPKPDAPLGGAHVGSGGQASSVVGVLFSKEEVKAWIGLAWGLWSRRQLQSMAISPQMRPISTEGSWHP